MKDEENTSKQQAAEKDREIIVSAKDQVYAETSETLKSPRRVGDFDATNAPLSADEIARQRDYLASEKKQAGEWAARTGAETTPVSADTRINTGLRTDGKELTDFNKTHAPDSTEWVDLDDDNRKPVK